jgi:hypothetical protein
MHRFTSCVVLVLGLCAVGCVAADDPSSTGSAGGGDGKADSASSQSPAAASIKSLKVSVILQPQDLAEVHFTPNGNYTLRMQVQSPFASSLDLAAFASGEPATAKQVSNTAAPTLDIHTTGDKEWVVLVTNEATERFAGWLWIEPKP